jgi:hypothetical protein
MWTPMLARLIGYLQKDQAKLRNLLAV